MKGKQMNRKETLAGSWVASIFLLRHRIRSQDGFQTAEAIGIAAVGLLVLAAIWSVLQALGVDVVLWIRDTFGIGSSAA